MKRRQFLMAGAGAAGTLAVGMLTTGGHAAPTAASAAAAPGGIGLEMGPWLRIAEDDSVTVLVPHIDMGQGSQTALAMMLADELDADWRHVIVAQAPADLRHANRFLARGAILGERELPWLVDGLADAVFGVGARFRNVQITGGSLAVRTTGQVGMRVIGAGARSLLLDAAAERLAVPRGELEARASVVRHAATGRSLRYGELAADAAQHSLPGRPKLKTAAQWTVMGSSPPRPDIPGKVNGSAPYDIDLQLPDMLVATVLAAPVHGETLQAVDPAPAMAVPGVHRVLLLDNAVAVVAEGFWAASRGRDALKPVWRDGGQRGTSTASIAEAQAQALREATGGSSGKKAVEHGNAQALLDAATPARTVRASYRVPLLHHAAMQPISGVAQFVDGHLTLWAGEQNPLGSKAAVLGFTGLKDEQVTIHPLPVGGSFGRRNGSDNVVTDHLKQLTAIARAMSPRPVKLIWRREEDFARGTFRPMISCDLAAVLGDDGLPAAWRQRVIERDHPEVAWELPYNIAHQSIRQLAVPHHIRLGNWRSVNHSQFKFFNECFVDELALAARRDPLDYRLAMLPAGSRGRAVLQQAAQASGWRMPLPAGHARGIALNASHGSWLAVVAEVSTDPAGRPRVHRLTAAVDCGPVVHADTARQQIEGGLVMGLSATLRERIDIADGAVVQHTFSDYRLISMAEVPQLEIHFINGGSIGGLGEPATSAVAPAVANAWSALTGTRVRELPLQT